MVSHPLFLPPSCSDGEDLINYLSFLLHRIICGLSILPTPQKLTPMVVLGLTIKCSFSWLLLQLLLWFQLSSSHLTQKSLVHQITLVSEKVHEHLRRAEPKSGAKSSARPRDYPLKMALIHFFLQGSNTICPTL